MSWANNGAITYLCMMCWGEQLIFPHRETLNDAMANMLPVISTVTWYLQPMDTGQWFQHWRLVAISISDPYHFRALWPIFEEVMGFKKVKILKSMRSRGTSLPFGQTPLIRGIRHIDIYTHTHTRHSGRSLLKYLDSIFKVWCPRSNVTCFLDPQAANQTDFPATEHKQNLWYFLLLSKVRL